MKLFDKYEEGAAQKKVYRRSQISKKKKSSSIRNKKRGKKVEYKQWYGTDFDKEILL